MNSSRLEQLLATPVMALPLTFVDVETTGLNPFFGDRVCEVAAVRYVGMVEVDRFVSLVNPRRPISAIAGAVNGITEDMVQFAPRFDAIAGELLRLFDDSIPVAHNAPFDLAFLAQELTDAGQTQPDTPAIDTLAIARRCFAFPRNSLGHIAAMMGIQSVGHRALSDALTTRQVLERFLAMLDGGDDVTLGELWSSQGGGVPWPIPAQRSTQNPSLLEAVQEHCPIRLHYVSQAGLVTDRLVDPLQIVGRPGADYLIAFCHLRKEQRSFRLDRIVGWERC